MSDETKKKPPHSFYTFPTEEIEQEATSAASPYPTTPEQDARIAEEKKQAEVIKVEQDEMIKAAQDLHGQSEITADDIIATQMRSGKWDKQKAMKFKIMADYTEKEMTKRDEMIETAYQLIRNEGKDDIDISDVSAMQIRKGNWTAEDAAAMERIYHQVYDDPELKAELAKKQTEAGLKKLYERIPSFARDTMMILHNASIHAASTALRVPELVQETMEFRLSKVDPYRDVRAAEEENRKDLIARGEILELPVYKFDAGAMADQLDRDVEFKDNVLRKVDEGTIIGSKWHGRVRSVGESLLTMMAAGQAGLSKWLIPQVFGVQEGSQAITQGRDAGLKGKDLWGYAGRKYAVEAGVATAFLGAGSLLSKMSGKNFKWLGGFEEWFGAGGKAFTPVGMKELGKRLGLALIAEIPEEEITEFGHGLTDVMKNPEMKAMYEGLSKKEKLGYWLNIAKETAIQTLMMSFGAGAVSIKSQLMTSLKAGELSNNIQKTTSLDKKTTNKIVKKALAAQEEGKDFYTELGREIHKEVLLTKEGVADFIKDNVKAAQKIADNPTPSRQDFQEAGLPQMVAEDRIDVSDKVREALAEETEAKAEVEEEIQAEEATEPEMTEEEAYEGELQEQIDALEDDMQEKYGDDWFDLTIQWETAKELGNKEKMAEIEKKIDKKDMAKYEKLIGKRSDIDVAEYNKIVKKIKTDVKKVESDDRIIKEVFDTYRMNESDFAAGVYTNMKNFLDTLKSEETARTAWHRIGKIMAEDRGADLGGMLSAVSGLTEKGKVEFKKQIDKRLKKILNAIKESLGEVGAKSVDVEVEIKKPKKKGLKEKAKEPEKQTPLGLDRKPVVNRELQKLSEKAFEKRYNEVKKLVDDKEANLEEKINDEQYRKELALLQDELDAFENEEWRREIDDAPVENVARELLNLTDTDTDKTKAVILLDVMQKRGEMNKLQKAIEEYAKKGPDYAEIAEGKIKRIQKTINEFTNLKQPKKKGLKEKVVKDEAVKNKESIDRIREIGVDDIADALDPKNKKILGSAHWYAYEGADITLEEFNEAIDKSTEIAEKTGKEILVIEGEDDIVGEKKDFYIYDKNEVYKVLKKHKISGWSAESFIKESNKVTFPIGTREKRAIDELFKGTPLTKEQQTESNIRQYLKQSKKKGLKEKGEAEEAVEKPKKKGLKEKMPKSRFAGEKYLQKSYEIGYQTAKEGKPNESFEIGGPNSQKAIAYREGYKAYQEQSAKKTEAQKAQETEGPELKELYSGPPPLLKKEQRVREDIVPDSVKADDVEVERRLQNAHGFKPVGILAKIKEVVKNVWASRRPRAYLPKTKELLAADEHFRLFDEIEQSEVDEANRTVAGVLDVVGMKQKILLERHEVMSNLLESVKVGQPLRFGLKSQKDLEVYLNKIKKVVAKTPEVAQAIKQRRAVVSELTQELVDNGLLSEEDVKDREAYYHQEVFQIVEGIRLAKKISKAGVRATKRGFQKKRVEGVELGEEYDYNTDIIEAEVIWMSEARIELAKKKWLDKLGEMYDKYSDINKEAKERGVSAETVAKEQGLELWSPRPGNIFYKATTIPQKLIAQIQKEGLATISKEDMKNVLAVGGMGEQMALPKAIVDQLNSMETPKQQGYLGTLSSSLMKSWKVWTLLNPKRALSYNLRNITGDIDPVLAGAAGSLKYIPQVLKELRTYYGGKLALSDNLRKARDLGVISSTLTQQEIPKLKDMEIFKRFYAEGKGLKNRVSKIGSYPAKYFEAMRKYSEFREASLRYATFLYYQDQLKAGTLKHYGGASKARVDEIQSVMGIPTAAAHLSRNLLGDYGNLSEFGNMMRKHVIPFFSWMEINTKRIPMMVVNAARSGFQEGGIKKAGAKAIATGSVYSAIATSRIATMYAIMWLFNNLFFREEEKELANYDRANPHLILNRNDDGSIMIFRNVGALGDFLEWFGINDLINLAPKYEAGQITAADLLAEVGKAPLNKIVQGFRPDIKGLFEIAAGQSYFPDVMAPRQRDRGELAAGVFGLADEYKEIKGKVFETGERMRPHWLKRLIGVTDPRRNALGEMYELREDFLKKEGKPRPSVFSKSPFRNIREAAMNNDYEAFKEALADFRAQGKGFRNFKRSLQYLDPIAASLNPADEYKFEYEFLTKMQREKLKRAREYSHILRDRLISWYEKAR